jgi:hypothetical protein
MVPWRTLPLEFAETEKGTVTLEPVVLEPGAVPDVDPVKLIQGTVDATLQVQGPSPNPRITTPAPPAGPKYSL